ncbi:hypothetical protein [Lacinutrix sp. Bg11-31]|uniref:hypothetical protein n=1 Tax=Lacinutrix sp. Bg11-31 TaxID=2057808 RepID=UPI000C30A5BF|nr:hypothetical protein [Lacinutrix sp. Bg11-31]AUC81610.1 hypothetical protein CW733_05470 [Lacinutrix sp. Bg11-31]
MKKRFHWFIEGLIFALIMFVFSIVLDVVSNDFAWDKLPKQILIWLAGGVVYGFVMHFIYKRSLNKLNNDERNNN